LGGVLNPLDFFLIIIGLITVIKLNPRWALVLVVWLGLVLLPASIGKTVPHALRTLSAAPIWLILAAVGLGSWLTSYRPSSPRARYLFQIGTGLFLLIYLGFFVRFYWHYQTVYPIESARDWQVGYKRLYSQLDQLSDRYPQLPIYVTREQGRPAMFYWFYHQTDPRLVQAAESQASKDQSEFLEFERFKFIDKPDQIAKPALVATSVSFSKNLGSDRQGSNYQLLSQIKLPNKEVIWQIGLLK